MDWSRVVESLIGTFAGGFLAIGSWWLKERFDRRRSAQAWYEENYIIEGVEQLRSYFMTVEMKLVDLYGLGSAKDVALPPVPYEAFTRVVRLTDCRGLLGVAGVLTRLGTLYHSRAYVWDCIGIVKMVGAHLDEISRDLSAERIRAKADIHRLAGKPRLSAFREKLEADIDARTQQLDAFLKRHPELEARAIEQP